MDEREEPHVTLLRNRPVRVMAAIQATIGIFITAGIVDETLGGSIVLAAAAWLGVVTHGQVTPWPGEPPEPQTEADSGNGEE